jgi:hypothetical protein
MRGSWQLDWGQLRKSAHHELPQLFGRLAPQVFRTKILAREMANAMDDNILATDFEDGSMSWPPAHAIELLAKLKRKVAAFSGEWIVAWIFRE